MANDGGNNGNSDKRKATASELLKGKYEGVPAEDLLRIFNSAPNEIMEELAKRHFLQMKACARSKFRMQIDEDEATEAAGNVMLAIRIRSLTGKICGVKALGAYVCKMLKNAVLKKRAERDRRMAVEEAYKAMVSDVVHGGGLSGTEAAQFEELQERIERLTAREREFYDLHFEGCPAEEVMERMGLRNEAAYVKVQSAVRNKILLSEGCFLADVEMCESLAKKLAFLGVRTFRSGRGEERR